MEENLKKEKWKLTTNKIIEDDLKKWKMTKKGEDDLKK
jgi:hypothetical protein